MSETVTAAPEPRRPKGEQTRDEILRVAARLATINGLEGLSIGDLADHVGMSKSGLYAHFGSKQELQLATIDAARITFMDEVMAPAFETPRGRARVVALCHAFLSYLERGVFPGGCFFAGAASEFSARPGPVRDRIVQVVAEFLSALEQFVREAQNLKEIDPSADPGQITFELHAILLATNNRYLLSEDPVLLDRARIAIDSLAVAPKRTASRRRRG
ncbi:MAG: TetR/AcrR family transcriptional regulator [Thermoanaerobaculia bacterium]